MPVISESNFSKENISYCSNFRVDDLETPSSLPAPSFPHFRSYGIMLAFEHKSFCKKIVDVHNWIDWQNSQYNNSNLFPSGAFCFHVCNLSVLLAKIKKKNIRWVNWLPALVPQFSWTSKRSDRNFPLPWCCVHLCALIERWFIFGCWQLWKK